MSSDKNYDDLLYPILCSEGNIVGFFDKIFEFLYRRTDFFKIKNVDPSSIGLTPGEAEGIVRSVFCKYMQQTVSEQDSELANEIDPLSLDYVAEEIVTTSEPELAEETSELAKVDLPEENSIPGNVIADDLKTNGTAHLGNRRDEDKSDRKIAVMDPDSYNGAQYEDYSWAQTIRDTDIRVKVPKTVTSGKQVRVNIQQAHLAVELFVDNQWSIVKEGSLAWKISVEESTWTLVPREHIHICLQKLQERWWESFFVGGPKIDLKTIDPSIAYEELDQDSQAKINELMYNEHLKRLGKPNIQQSKIQNILREAWDQEGSPFKGQPFDPTRVNIQN